MNHDKDSKIRAETQQDEPFLLSRMVGIVNEASSLVGEH